MPSLHKGVLFRQYFRQQKKMLINSDFLVKHKRSNPLQSLEVCGIIVITIQQRCAYLTGLYYKIGELIMQLQDRLLRQSEIVKLTSLSKSTIRRKERSGEFPKRINLGGNCVVWRLSDYQKWVDGLN